MLIPLDLIFSKIERIKKLSSTKINNVKLASDCLDTVKKIIAFLYKKYI